MGIYNGTIKNAQTESGQASAGTTAPVPGCAVIPATSLDGATAAFAGAATGAVFAFGVAAGVAPMTTVANQQTYGTGNPIQVYTPGGEALILLSSAVTDITIPLVNTSANSIPTGFAPATAGQHAMCWARETGAANTYIRAFVEYITY